MSADQEKTRLVRLIRKASPKKCLDFFAHRDEKDRRRFASSALETMTTINEERWSSVSSGKPALIGKSLHEQLVNAQVCVLATASVAEIKRLGWQAVPGEGLVVDVIGQRNPAWVNEWVQHLSENEPRMYFAIRLLYSAGLCDKPNGDGYILGMIEGLGPRRVAPAALWDPDTSIAQRIRRTPDIKEHDVWRIFDVEGGGDLSLAACDKYTFAKEHGWTSALLELSADGTLSRERLLDESLNALARDFAQFRAGWFSRFLTAMEPTLDERAAHREQYLGLLASSIAPTVSFALKAIVALDKANRVLPDDVVASIGPVLQARAKGTVNTGLRLLSNAVKKDPAQAMPVSRLAATALIHESADVQKTALDLIDSLGCAGDAQLDSALRDYADGIAPSLRSRLATMIGLADTPELAPATTTARVADVEPIESFDEFMQAFLHTLEDPSEPLSVERTLDALARLGAAKPLNFNKIAGPLGKRASTILKNHPDDSLQYQIARLALAYASGESLDSDIAKRYPNVDISTYRRNAEREFRSFEEVFLLRNVFLLEQVSAGHRLPLLSAPTDTRGFIATQALLSRYAQYKARGVAPGTLDTALALMRLAPEERGSVLQTLQPQDEFEHALAFALGGELLAGKTDWLWVAAAAARRPYGDEPAIAKKFGRGLPDAGTCARYLINFESTTHFIWLRLRVEPTVDDEVPATFLPALFHLCSASTDRYGSVCGHHVNMIRWCSTVWPLHLEPFFSQGVLVMDHTQRLANSPYAGFLEPMLEPHVAIGENGSTLLALGLASTDPAVRSIALESAIASIDEGRLDATCMQLTLAALIPSGHAPVGRWTKSLTELSGVSRRHAQVVRDWIEGALRHDPASPPRGIGGLIELLYELTVAVEQPIRVGATIDYLTGLRIGGKARQFARKLVAAAS